ncbi:hypothetical protein QNH98_05515 [Myroides sp. mNGS23_01]|nr:hypothetical protein [Myroides sp. mNGS23_01]WHT40088.1 hypothetical protein QNH98_05515 [Myroides sp. mNGS23_01]
MRSLHVFLAYALLLFYKLVNLKQIQKLSNNTSQDIGKLKKLNYLMEQKKIIPSIRPSIILNGKKIRQVFALKLFLNLMGSI